ncbi:MAG: hypothetical protein K2W96_12950 [Gemmataceae bacterium]|nr:hypothetical protein [Gemmataceae bacterium]
MHEELETLDGGGLRIQNLAFLPDGKALLTLPESTGLKESYPVCFWEPATGKRIPQPLAR